MTRHPEPLSPRLGSRLVRKLFQPWTLIVLCFAASVAFEVATLIHG